MADKKISALTAASTPLAGTEVLPIVQGASTVKVAVSDLTAGRAVSASGVTSTGNSTFNTTANIGWRVGARSDNAISAIYTTSTTPDSTNYALQASSTITYLNSPGATSLAVSDNAIATATTTALTLPNANLVIGTTGKGITTGSAIPLGLGVNNTVTAMTINTSSNVGVGTASPSSKFNVVGDQIIIGSADGTGVLGVQIKGTSLGAIPAAQVQGYIATGNSTIGVAGDLLIACRTDVAAGVRIITGTTPAERVIVNGSGNVGIGTSTPAATAILDVQSTTKGVRFPNMTTAQKTAITPSAGTVIFDTTLAKLCVYSGAAWQTITSV